MDIEEPTLSQEPWTLEGTGCTHPSQLAGPHSPYNTCCDHLRPGHAAPAGAGSARYSPEHCR